MSVWVAMTVVIGWIGITRGQPSPRAVIAISLRGLSSIKHAQESLMTSGTGIIYHPAITNDSNSILKATTSLQNVATK